jgi:hypothetical protein
VDLPAHLEFRVRKETWVHKARPGSKALVEILAFLAHKAFKAGLAQLVQASPKPFD